ncbi:MAG: hypothetical protein LKJ86_01680 [Oscillibacter sp.]|jgi:hypothetical protein|nr:hypothetical protein [Oscillibacter sp.]
MGEFDDKLNALLNNPDSMAQIMQLAQSLGGGTASGAPGASPNAAAQEPPTPPPPTGNPPPAWTPPPAPAAGGADFLSSLTGGLDPKLISRLLPLVQELNSSQNSSARQLMYALRPYLKPERQEKVERALQLARLIHLGKKFLSESEG